MSRTEGTYEIHYVYKDHLGSWTTITNAGGVVEREQSFDAWGNMRDPETWSGDYNNTLMFDRGFTGHEHLYDFGLINMNGRVYDPVMSTFLSPDNYIQAPDNSQNFNRYAYCLNNPLKYTDPSGESIVLAVLVGAFWSSAMSLAVNFDNISTDADFVNTVTLGALGGAVGGAAGFVAGGAVAGVLGTEGAIPGFLTSASGGFAGSLAGTSVTSWCTGASFGDGLMAGLKAGAISGLTAGLIGAYNGAIEAINGGGEMWWGIGSVSSSDIIPELYQTSDFDIRSYQLNIQRYEDALAEGACSICDVGVGDIGLDRLSTDITSSTNENVIRELASYSTSRRGYIEIDGVEKFGISVKSGRFNSEVFISPRVVDGYMKGYCPAAFDATIKHEFTHVFHRFKYGNRAFKGAAKVYGEYAAQHVSKNVYYSYGLSMAGHNITYHPYPDAFIVPADYKFSILNFRSIYPKDWRVP